MSYDETRQAIEDAREARRMSDSTNGNGRIKVDPMVAFQVIAWIVAALLTYGAVNARISVVETQMNQFKQDVSEMKSDIKTLLRR